MGRAFREGVSDLPVVEALPAVEAALEGSGAAVLVAPPGAGKTTVVPLALLDAPWLDGRRIVVLEPRRLATRAAARRMASLLGEPDAGGSVGYRIRLDTRVGPRTRIEVVTEGVLTRMLQDDPALSGVGCVVFDELHERSLHADAGLALAIHARSLLRPDLRLLAMSATLDAAPVADLVGGPVVESEGRLHPVETLWRSRPVEGWIEPPVAATVLQALGETEGDVLVFLPGAGEIRRTAERLQEAGLPAGTELHPLYGDLGREAQDRAIAPSPPGRRKVVLATAIAETSLTIEGVRVVVDGGRMRVPRFDPGTGMTRLDTIRVTRDAADQRRGRAGRTAPGVCYRLWTEAEERGLVPHRRPEILEADLAPLALDLAVWGARPSELRWLTPPPRAAFAQAGELLRELEALDGDGTATAHGRAMARMGLHPRLAHMILRGGEQGRAGAAADLAALLGGRDVVRARGRAPDADLRPRLDLLRRARARGPGRVSAPGGLEVRRGGLARALDEARHLRRSTGASADGEGGGSEGAGEVGLLLAFAYPDRIGRLREGGRGTYLLRNGRGARFFEDQALADEEWIVAAEVQEGGRDARIFRAAPLDPADVERHFSDSVEEADEVEWDPDAGRVRAFRRRRLGALVLSEAPLADPPPDAVARRLVAAVRDAGLHLLPWSKETRQLRERLAFLHHLDPDAWPDASEAALEATLEQWLTPFVPGMRSLDDLRAVDLGAALLSRAPADGRSRLDVLAPTHLEVPSGSRIALDYSDPASPTLSVRVQEVFGLTETPRVAGGRVAVTVALLSPAHRPVQVTRDLASFWRDAYQEVRKNLRGRYPKHAWPDDPLSAEPTRRTGRRRG